MFGRGADVFFPGAFIHNADGELFEIIEREAGFVWLENCMTPEVHVQWPVLRLRDNERWKLVRRAPGPRIESD